MTRLLADEEVARALAELPGWEQVGQGICKHFVFADFSRAFAFMARCASVAESLGHHPDWRNSYKRVTITLTTHDAGGVSEKDIAFARAAEEIALSFTSSR